MAKQDCLVCFDPYPVARMIFCQVSELDLHQEMVRKGRRSSVALLAMNNSPARGALLGSPARTATKSIFPGETNYSEETSGGRKEVDVVPPEHHGFCRECIRGGANAATSDAPLAPGGLGLRCMEPKCKQILRFGTNLVFFD